MCIHCRCARRPSLLVQLSLRSKGPPQGCRRPWIPSKGQGATLVLCILEDSMFAICLEVCCQKATHLISSHQLMNGTDRVVELLAANGADLNVHMAADLQGILNCLPDGFRHLFWQLRSPAPRSIITAHMVPTQFLLFDQVIASASMFHAFLCKVAFNNFRSFPSNPKGCSCSQTWHIYSPRVWLIYSR